MKNHIAIIDGTLSRLDYGQETHAGKLFKLALHMDGKRRTIHYDPGVQGKGLKKWAYVASGAGLNLSVTRIYRRLSEVYREGDRIYLFGYSRGAYAMRLVAGLIDKIGLLRREYATLHYAETSLKLFSPNLPKKVIEDFRSKYCYEEAPIEFIGVWDTVKALGLPIPFLHHLSPLSINFKDHAAPRNVKFARQALAQDETRTVYTPELWQSASPNTDLKQMLFAGDHGVVGGQILYNQEVRKLANFSFIWMMEEAEKTGLILPNGWKENFPTDQFAPSDDDSSLNERFWIRAPRKFIPPEYFEKHPSLIAREEQSLRPKPH